MSDSHALVTCVPHLAGEHDIPGKWNMGDALPCIEIDPGPYISLVSELTAVERLFRVGVLEIQIVRFPLFRLPEAVLRDIQANAVHVFL